MGVGTATRTGRRQPTGRLPRRYVTEIGPHGRRTMPAGRALLVILIALLLGALLNVQSLTEMAERNQPGLRRDISMVLVWPFQQVSELLGLDEPRALLSERLGRDADAGIEGSAVAVAAGGAAGDDPGGDALVEAAGLTGVSGSDLVLGTTPALPAMAGQEAVPGDPVDGDRRALSTRLEGPFDQTNPLQVTVVGDSLTEQVGPALIARLGRPGVPAEGHHDFAYSSGLSRPDFYDWPARIAQLAQEQDPDIWVVMMGANDGQDVIDDDGQFHQIGSEEWNAIYGRRVGELMDQMTADGRAVIWVGQPVMRDVEFDERMAHVSSVYAAQAAQRQFVSYVDAREIFTTEDGQYADYLPAGDGQLSQMRLPDGIHLTRSGAERIITRIMPLLPINTG